MKKFNVALLLLITSISFAQSTWPRNPVNVTAGENPKLGIANKRSLNFVTDGQIRVVADSNGLFRINRLAGKGYRLVYVDSLGNLGARFGGDPADALQVYWNTCDGSMPLQNTPSSTDPAPCPSAPCVINSGPWFEGGNKIGNSGNNSIGTCNAYDFILKANGSNRMWIKTDGKIGMGTSTPITDLELRDSDTTELLINSTSSKPASAWVMNSSDNYALLVDNNGIGHISQNRTSINHLLGFKYNTSNSVPEQVWVGTRPTTGPHTDFNFAVAGKLVCKSLYVSVTGTWADYVFNKDYKLKPLNEVEAFIIKNGHLPNVPSAKELEKEEYNLDVVEIQKIQMEKIEELFLYTIKLEKEIEKLKIQNEELIKIIKK